MTIYFWVGWSLTEKFAAHAKALWDRGMFAGPELTVVPGPGLGVSRLPFAFRFVVAIIEPGFAGHLCAVCQVCGKKGRLLPVDGR